MIADDHLIFRAGISHILQEIFPDGIIDEVGTYDRLIELTKKGSAPSLFILDLHFPGMDIEKAVQACEDYVRWPP